MTTKFPFSSFLALVLLITGALSGTLGCTNEKSSIQSSGQSAGQSSGSAAARLTDPAKPANQIVADACSPEELAPFDRVEGEVVELDRESLPRGLYLATVSAMLVEKKNEGAAPSRVLIQEAAGGKGEIACAEGMDKLGHDFEVSLSGLVKFQTNDKSQASAFVTRQFYFYQDRNGYGAALSNPHLGGVVAKPDDLKHLLRNNGQIVRLSEKSYLVRYLRDVDGVKARLLIRLELVPN